MRSFAVELFTSLCAVARFDFMGALLSLRRFLTSNCTIKECVLPRPPHSPQVSALADNITLVLSFYHYSANQSRLLISKPDYLIEKPDGQDEYPMTQI